MQKNKIRNQTKQKKLFYLVYKVANKTLIII